VVARSVGLGCSLSVARCVRNGFLGNFGSLYAVGLLASLRLAGGPWVAIISNGTLDSYGLLNAYGTLAQAGFLLELGPL
jgi:hypothetical protein